MSTISTARCADLAREHARQGQGYVAAPVFGNPDAAKARQLFIVAAGEPADVERCRPLMDALGQQTFMVGTDPAHANLIKLLGNMMTATTLEMLGETVALVRKRGLDPEVLRRHPHRDDVWRASPQNLRRQRSSPRATRPDSPCLSRSRTSAWRLPKPRPHGSRCLLSASCGIGSSPESRGAMPLSTGRRSA